jgi:hypothetical protein
MPNWSVVSVVASCLRSLTPRMNALRASSSARTLRRMTGVSALVRGGGVMAVVVGMVGAGRDLFGEVGDDGADEVHDGEELVGGQAMAVRGAVVAQADVDGQRLVVDGDLVGRGDDDVVALEVGLADAPGRSAVRMVRPGESGEVAAEGVGV